MSRLTLCMPACLRLGQSQACCIRTSLCLQAKQVAWLSRQQFSRCYTKGRLRCVIHQP